MRTVDLTIVFGLLLVAWPAGQKSRPPVVDAHTHVDHDKGPATMAGLNVRYWFLSTHVGALREWAKVPGLSGKYLPSLAFPCPSGRGVITGKESCFDTPDDFPNIDWLRGEIAAGRIKAFGELLPAYLGIAPNDPRMEPYWALAEEFDLPAMIHMGPGPPAAAYDASPIPAKHPNFRMAAGNPMLLEDVLLRHKRLRVSIAHAGWPRLDETLALLYAHPNVYVDTGGLHSDRIVPRAGYYRYLQALVDNGFGKRIMFASDFPDQIEEGIDAILAAGLLTDAQRADILCHNAARFLRLDNSICS